MTLLKTLQLNNDNFGACITPETWCKTTQHGVIESMNPTTETVIARVYNANANDYEAIIQASQQAFLHWRTVPAPKRGDIVRQIGNKLRQYKSELGSLVATEMGKSKQEGDGEVQEMIDMADLAAGMSRQLCGKTLHSERPRHRMYEQWHPLGIVGVISAFNFPVAVWSWNAFVAAICGNTVVWKGAPQTPLCTLAVQRICNEVMIENHLPGIFSCWITDDNELATTMVKDARIHLLSFTGSSRVGKWVAETLASRMGKYLLECSGNNAVILAADADLQLAVPAIVFGAVGTAGQRCTSTRRLIIHSSIAEPVTRALQDAYQKITIGDPNDTRNLMGPLIDQNAVDNFIQAVADAKQAGGHILFGGNTIDRDGFFVEPTLIQAENHWDVVQRETFAPILYVMTYNTLDEAIAMQNNVEQGLSSAIFTQSLKTAEHFLACSGSDCGIANVNIGTSGAEIGGAFGGEKTTGGGREAGSDSWKAYMRRQTTTINWGDELPLAQGVEFNVE